VDVSKEWNEHALSSSTLLNQSHPAGSSPSNPASEAVVAESSGSLACGCESLTPQERLEDSTYAFTGTVGEAPVTQKGKRSAVFDVDEIFKGSPKPEMTVTEDIVGTDCDLPFEEEQSYLVFARWEWGTVVTSRCMGTKLLAKARTAALGPSEQLKEKLYLRLHNACMGRLDTSCCLSSIKAMHEGYYVPEPEEGCAEGAVPDRLHCGGSYTWCIPVTEKGHSQPEH